MTRTYATLPAAAALALAACTGGAPEAGGPWRAAGAPIHSIALFDQSRLAGSWVEVAGFGPRPGCAGGRLEVAPGGAAAVAAPCALPMAGRVRLVPSGPGRFTVGRQEFWVLWVDADYRTLVLGTPSGAFGAVLNRDAAIPEDRMVAARRVLEFNGYDTAGLAAVPAGT